MDKEAANDALRLVFKALQNLKEFENKFSLPEAFNGIKEAISVLEEAVDKLAHCST